MPRTDSREKILKAAMEAIAEPGMTDALMPAQDSNGVREPTPRSDGFRLPARFCEHRRTLMSWPCREDLFGPLMGAARREWAEVARGIDRFEPITVIVDPSQEAEARSLLGPDVEILVVPLDDSWIRDNGPIFVRDAQGNVAAVKFRFDGWNRQFRPLRQRRRGTGRIAEAWGVRLYEAPYTLEGGAFNTDGEGTLVTTEQCLLHNRNLGLSRADNEALLREWLGIDRVIWLPFGLVEDSGPYSTSGHVDDVAQFVAPGVVVAQTAPKGNANHTLLQENLEVLRQPPTPPAAGSRSSSWSCSPM